MGKQLEVPGTQRTDIPPEILEAGKKWLDANKEQRRTKEKAKEAKFGLIALMEARKIPKFRYLDPETKEMKSLSIDLEPKLSVRKADEDPSADTSSESSGGASSSPAVHPGLIAQAEAAQAGAEQTKAGVSVDDEGDVVPPDTAAPKSGKRKKAGK
jgi:hypothetical protein